MTMRDGVGMGIFLLSLPCLLPLEPCWGQPMKQLLLKGSGHIQPEGKGWEIGIRHQPLALLTSSLIPEEDGPPHACLCLLLLFFQTYSALFL